MYYLEELFVCWANNPEQTNNLIHRKYKEKHITALVWAIQKHCYTKCFPLFSLLPDAFLRPRAERLRRPGGVLQAVASEEAGAAAEGETAGGAEEAGGGQWLPPTQPRGVRTCLQTVSSFLHFHFKCQIISQLLKVYQCFSWCCILIYTV